MRRTSRSTIHGTVVAAVLTLTFGAARADLLGDHLKCYKGKDTATKATYTADLTPSQPSFPLESGCLVKVPAKLFCTSVSKTNVSPTPPGAQAGETVTVDFACYKLKCPKGEFQVPVLDQFGQRTMTVKAPKLLCAPSIID